MAGYAHPESLVSTHWLARHLSDPDLRVADATYFLPSMGKNLQAEFEAKHIPGAVLFDIDEIADSDNPLPHMLPSPEKFASHMRKLGIGDGNRVVVYDAHGLMSATRAWWMLRIFGHDDVALLDGGLPKWIAEGRPVEEGPAQPRERHFTARFDHGQVRDKAQMKANLDIEARAGAGCPRQPPLHRVRARSLAGPPARSYPRLAQPALHRSAEPHRQDPAVRRSAHREVSRRRASI